jgi:hypothetical protein
VLGGFLITAIALLFDRTTCDGVHTLALFASAVLILMLASHAVNKVPHDNHDDAAAFSFLAGLGGWLTFAAAMTTTLILSETSCWSWRSSDRGWH